MFVFVLTLLLGLLVCDSDVRAFFCFAPPHICTFDWLMDRLCISFSTFLYLQTPSAALIFSILLLSPDDINNEKLLMKTDVIGMNVFAFVSM